MDVVLISVPRFSLSARLARESEEAKEAAEVAARKDLVKKVLQQPEYNLLASLVDVLAAKIIELGVTAIQQKITNRDTADLHALCGNDFDTYGQFGQGTIFSFSSLVSGKTN